MFKKSILFEFFNVFFLTFFFWISFSWEIDMQIWIRMLSPVWLPWITPRSTTIWSTVWSIGFWLASTNIPAKDPFSSSCRAYRKSVPCASCWHTKNTVSFYRCILLWAAKSKGISFDFIWIFFFFFIKAYFVLSLRVLHNVHTFIWNSLNLL